jgi:hypothetical protein
MSQVELNQIDAAKEAMREACLQACRDQAAAFLSSEYATPQPMGSIQERFACNKCIEAIEAIPASAHANENAVKQMVDRFLAWRLPKDFSPDDGISAKRPNYAPEVEWAPTGTNLLTASQAEAMVRHMLAGN